MASAGPVAAHRADRFPPGPVADLTCGIGGDSLALARRGPVVAADLDPARVWMTRRNATALDTPYPLLAVRADAAEPAVGGVSLFVDPARRTAGGQRARRGAEYCPPLDSLSSWRRLASTLAVKVSPALNEAEWPAEADEIEFVSWRGQCREAVLWFGVAGAARRRATVIGAESLTWDEEEAPGAPVGPAGAYLFEPDPAVVRSHLVGLLAQRLDAWLLDPQVAYLSAAEPRQTPLARCFRVLRCEPYSRRLHQVLVGEGWRPTEALRRRFPVEPATLLRQLRSPGDRAAEPVSLLCTRVDERPVVFICSPCGH
jgi:hypothetical protein